MNFLIVLFAIAIEMGSGGLSALRSARWSHDWFEFSARIRARQSWMNGWIAVVFILVLPAIGIAVIFLMLDSISSLLMHFGGLATLLLMLGPADLARDFEHSQRARQTDDEIESEFSSEVVSLDLGDSGDADEIDDRRALAELALHADRAWYQPIFWYFVLGPVAVVLYRLLSNLRGLETTDSNDEVIANLNRVRGWVEYVPRHIGSFCFGLAGSLVPVIDELGRRGLTPGDTHALVVHSALAAIDNARINEVITGNPGLYRLNQMMSLLKRALIAWLVLLALLALVIY